jgi:hypothetical protein
MIYRHPVFGVITRAKGLSEYNGQRWSDDV